MEHLPEFISNNLLLVGALLVVLAMLIKAEYEHQTSRGSQVSPVNAVRVMNQEAAVVLDVRTEAEFNGGHIKGAINLPMSAFNKRLIELEKHKANTILAYCNSGHQSARACRILLKSGFTKVQNISGGVHGWQDANLPLTKS